MREGVLSGEGGYILQLMDWSYVRVKVCPGELCPGELCPEIHAESSQTMEWYDRTTVGWREGETPGNRSDLCKGIHRSAVMNSLWYQFIHC